jgi:hypothetical protein
MLHAVLHALITSCAFFGPGKTDYADTTVSKVAVNSSVGAKPLAACCAACVAWNANLTLGAANRCSIGVVHAHTNVQSLCSLKASALRPFASATATAVQPPGV